MLSNMVNWYWEYDEGYTTKVTVLLKNWVIGGGDGLGTLRVEKWVDI